MFDVEMGLISPETIPVGKLINCPRVIHQPRSVISLGSTDSSLGESEDRDTSSTLSVT